MRSFFLSLALIAVLSGAAAQSVVSTKNHVAVDPSDSTRYLFGPCDKSGLLEGEFAAWARPGYEAYRADGSDCVELLQKARWAGVKIEVFFATWCGDSKYQVPRFLKLAELARVPDSCVSLIALDGNKCGPCGEEQNRQIHRVPTFIVSRNGTELGRIVEWTDRSLAEDLWRILSRYRYTPHYATANQLMKEIDTKGAKAVERRAHQLAQAQRPMLKNASELAVVTYVYFVRKQMDAAAAVAKVNALSFAESATAQFWMGRISEEKGQRRRAIAYYRRSVALDPTQADAYDRLKALTAASAI